MKIKILSMGNMLNLSTNKIELGIEVLFENNIGNSKETLSLVGTYFKNGKINSYPSLNSVKDNPLYYITLGKVMESMYKFEGENAKNAFSNCLVIYEKYNKKIESIKSSEGYISSFRKKKEAEIMLNSIKKKSNTSSEEISKLMNVILHSTKSYDLEIKAILDKMNLELYDLEFDSI